MRKLLTALFLGGLAFAQTTVVLSPVPKLQFFDNSGRPLAFGCVFTYTSTTVTPLATYTDYTGVTQNANPVILSSGGFASIWLQAGLNYTLRVKSSGGTNCASGTQLYSIDGIGGGSAQATTVVPYSPTPQFIDGSQNQLFEITLTGNAVSQPLVVSGVTPPGLITWQITQDGIGGHTFGWPVNVLGGAPIGLSPNQVTTQHFVWNGITAWAVGPATIGVGPELSTGTLRVTGDATISGLATVGSSLLVGTTLNVGSTGLFGGAITAPGFYTPTANPATAGLFRLAASDQACWRDTGNTTNLCIFSDAIGINHYLNVDSVHLGATGSGSTIFATDSTNLALFAGNVTASNGRSVLVGAGNAAGGVFSGGGIILNPGRGNGGGAAGIVQISNGMNADSGGSGAGFEHTRTGSCTTAAAAGATCSTTVSWATAFADANYTLVCTIDTPTNVPYVLSTDTKGANSFHVVIAALTAAAASGTLNCIAAHD
jgi:hypothetical protein